MKNLMLIKKNQLSNEDEIEIKSQKSFCNVTLLIMVN